MVIVLGVWSLTSPIRPLSEVIALGSQLVDMSMGTLVTDVLAGFEPVFPDTLTSSPRVSTITSSTDIIATSSWTNTTLTGANRSPNTL